MEGLNSSLTTGEETVGLLTHERSFHLPRPVLEHIFSSLGPHELAVAANVCRTWHAAASHGRWQEFYSAFWPLPQSFSSDPARWRQAFCQKMLASRSLRGRPITDHLVGHNSGVKVAKIVPNASDLLLTGSVDRRLILWDLKSGTQLDASPFHAGTVRCLVFDDSLLATGSSDHRIRVWPRWREGNGDGGTENEDDSEDEGVDRGNRGQLTRRQRQRIDDFPFRVDGPRVVLAGGHAGPVSALQLCPTALFSGSWDYCVRVWDRTACQDDDVPGPNAPNSQWPQLNCTQVLHFDDWVMDMSLKANSLYVASGGGVHMVDAGQGGGLKPISELRHHHHMATVPAAVPAAVTTVVAGAEDGHMVYYGTAEGGVFSYDTRSPATQQPKPFSCSSAVTGLSWEYPWLAASLQNGEVVLLNTSSSRNSAKTTSRILNPGTTRAGGAQCVDLKGLVAVAGFESGTVVTWDFQKAEESERIAQEMRAGRRKARERRRVCNAAQRRSMQASGRRELMQRSNESVETPIQRQNDDGDGDAPAVEGVPLGWRILRRPLKDTL